MVKIPLSKRIRRKLHREIALAQDFLVEEIYHSFPEAVIHGGTAIWRCYRGNRFSEDVDVYLRSFDKESMDGFIERLKERGFSIAKFKATKNAIFSNISYRGTVIRFEAVRKNFKNYSARKFEMIDGSFIIVNTLSPDWLIKEKIEAYLNRGKIRDLYDIFFLLDYVEEKKVIENDLANFLNNFSIPVDEPDLQAIIITGAVPKTKDMINEIKRWAR